jgi:hypothetical protein
MGLKGYRLWATGQLDSTCRAPPREWRPYVLAPPADSVAWRFRWERMIQSTVTHQLADMGGDTVGGCVVVGGDAEIDAAVDAFVVGLYSLPGDVRLVTWIICMPDLSGLYLR